MASSNKQILAEIIPKRTANAKHYRLLDGTMQAMIFGNDIHFYDETGSWQNIDTTLFDEADFDRIEFAVYQEKAKEFHSLKAQATSLKSNQTLDRQRGYFHGLRVPHNSKIAKQWRKGYQVGKGTDSLKFVPVGASPTFGYVDPADNSKIEYQDAWNDSDVCLELLSTGVKETITLKSASAPTTFTFQVIGNLTTSTMTAGQLAIQPAWLQDANGTKKDVTQTVRTGADGNTYLDLVADTTGLAFPVVIDPTVTIQQTADTSGSANQSAYVYQGAPTTIYGNTANLIIGNNTGNAYRSLVQMDVSSITANASVISASLYMETWTQQSGASSPVNPFNVTPYQNSASWAEGSIIWNNKPAFGIAANSSISYAWTATPPASTWYNCNVANIVQNWVNGQANYGFQLVSNVENNASNSQEINFYNGAQGSNSPYLSINYDVPPTAPGAITAPAAGATVNSTAAITWGAASDSSTASVAPFSDTATIYSYEYSNTYDKVAQTFTTPSDATYLTTFKVYAAIGTATALNADIYTVDSNLYPSTLVKSCQINVTGGGLQTFTANVALQPNTTYTVVCTVDSPSTSDGWGTISSNNPSGLQTHTVAGGWSGRSTTLSLYLTDMSFTTNPSQLTYQIDLSTNNGSSWTNIVSQTSAGATSYTYDFSNVTASATCLLRVRAFDGYAYGPYVQSSAPFTIQHDQAPLAPTNLQVPNFDATKAQVFTWQFNDPDTSDSQSAFALQIFDTSNPSTPVFTVPKTGSAQTNYTLPANTLQNNKSYQWQVQTYDQGGLQSPWSQFANFKCGAAPTLTVTAPANGGSVPSNIYTFKGQYIQANGTTQQSFQFKLWDAAGANILQDSIMLTGYQNQYQFSGLANNTSYMIEFLALSSDNITATSGKVPFSVSYTPPSAPTVTGTPNQTTASNTVNWNNPSGGSVAVQYNRLYKQVAGTWSLYQDNLSASSYTDYLIGGNVAVTYGVSAMGTNNVESAITPITLTCAFTGDWLYDTTTGNQFQFIYNRKPYTMDTQVTRKAYDTFGTHRMIRWGPQNSKHGTLAALTINSVQTPAQQIQTFEASYANHPAYYLKTALGDLLKVDVFNYKRNMPEEFLNQHAIEISVEWEEVS